MCSHTGLPLPGQARPWIPNPGGRRESPLTLAIDGTAHSSLDERLSGQPGAKRHDEVHTVVVRPAIFRLDGKSHRELQSIVVRMIRGVGTVRPQLEAPEGASSTDRGRLQCPADATSPKCRTHGEPEDLGFDELLAVERERRALTIRPDRLYEELEESGDPRLCDRDQVLVMKLCEVRLVSLRYGLVLGMDDVDQLGPARMAGSPLLDQVRCSGGASTIVRSFVVRHRFFTEPEPDSAATAPSRM